jgi:hypothetical protein
MGYDEKDAMFHSHTDTMVIVLTDNHKPSYLRKTIFAEHNPANSFDVGGWAFRWLGPRRLENLCMYLVS